MLKNKPFWFSIALTAAYLLAAYLAVPHWLQPKLEQYVKLQLGRQLQFEKLQFDPLTWSAELTGVRLLDNEPGATGEPGLFPDIALTAESVHLRFNFWQLRAAVSTLIVKAGVVTIDGNSTLMQSGHYPLVSQWQQWRSARYQKDADEQAVSIRSWRLETGRLEITYPGTQQSDTILLHELLMQADKLNAAGQREYRLAFTTAVGSTLQMQGQLDGSALVSMGQYQWTSIVWPATTQVLTQPGANPQFNAAGEFSIAAQGDLLLIELAQSQLSAEQAGRCVLNGLLCAMIHPLNVDFSARLQLSMHGVRWLDAQLQLDAFAGDASLAQEAVSLVQQQKFESASLRIKNLSESADWADQEQPKSDTLEFDLALQKAKGLRLDVQGQYQPNSEQAGMQFTSQAEPELRGDLQWQWIAAQQAEAAYPQVELQLENPTASLAQGFIAEYLSSQLSAAALHLQLTAKLKDRELRFSQKIRLKQVNGSAAGLSPIVLPELLQSVRPSVQPSVRQSVQPSVQQSVQPSVLAGEPTMDVAWLLALLQDPQSDIELTIPEQTIFLTERLSLRDLTMPAILAFLKRVSVQAFEGLALQIGQAGRNLAAVQFESGSAELNASSSESLSLLAAALVQRPGLGIGLAGVYDPLIDLKALQTEQVRTHIALATAAELAFQSGSEPPDFSNPQVHSVIDEFARRRLPAEVLSAFAGHFGAADVDRGLIPEGDIAAYYAALFELLVDYAEIPQGALITLARYRAQAVIELLAEQGVSRDRMHTAAQPLSSVAELSGVPLQLQLILHSVKSPELLEDSSSGGFDFQN